MKTGQSKPRGQTRSGSKRKRSGAKPKDTSPTNGFDEIFLRSRDGMVLMDCQTWDIIDINPSFEQMLGYKRNELQGRKIWELPKSDNGEKLKRAFFEIFQKGTSHLDFVPINTKANEIINVELNTTLIDGSGQKSMLCICRPTSNGFNSFFQNSFNSTNHADQMKMEQFSLELLENANLIVIFIDTHGDITLFNRQAEAFTGKSSEEVSGKKFYDVLFEPKQRAKIKSKFEQMLEDSDFIETLEYPIRNIDGLERMIHWRNSLISNSTEGHLGILTIGEDVTEMKVMERRLKLYSDAIKSSIDSMIITDLNGYIIYNNRAAEAVYGYRSGELLGKNYNVFYPADNSPKVASMLKMLIKKDSWQGEHLHRRKDGTLSTVYQTMSMIKDENEKPIAIMMVGRDITTTKRLEHELRTAKRQSEFYLDILTHDLNNLNQGILGQLELMKNGNKMPHTNNHNLESAITQVHSGIGLINNVKKLTNIEYNEKNFKAYDLSSVLDYCFKRTRMRYPAKKIRLWGNFMQVSFRIHVDEFIYELFINLLDNAVKFDRRKDVEIGINLNKIKWELKDHVKINVLDRGCGVPPTERNLIFERFRGSKSVPNSSGLGLSIVKALVNRYGGDIWVEDRVPGDYSKGSVFCVVMPLK